MTSPQGTPRTWFSGSSSPEDGPSGPDKALIQAAVLVGILAFSPVGAVVAFFWYVVFAVARFSWKVVAGAAGIWTLLMLIGGGFSGPFLGEYLSPWRELFDPANGGVAKAAAENWTAWLWMQTPFSIWLGTTFAAFYCAYRWMRRPAWETYDRRPGPIDYLRKKNNVKNIETDLKGSDNGLTLGIGAYGKRVFQMDTEAAAHTLIAGGSGAGKTTTSLIGQRDVIRLGRAVIYVDLKGGPDVPAQLAEWAARYGRKFMHWSILDPRFEYTGPANGPAFYDPIGRGDASRRKDLLIGSQKWDVEYYKTVISNYLQAAFSVSTLVPPPPHIDSFTDVTSLLNPKNLVARVDQIPPGEWEDLRTAVYAICNGMEESERSGIRNMYARLQTLMGSTAGAWLRKDPNGTHDIDLRRAADEGWVVVFSLDSSNYGETSAQIAGLIIQDLKTLSSELRINPAPAPVHVTVDEFSAVDTDNILGLLARARDAKMPVALSTQALADLKRTDPSFVDQVLGIVNCFIIHRANTEADAEVFAGLTGKKMVFRKQYGIEMTSGLPGMMGRGAATGGGFIKEEEEYVVLPSAFQALKPGQMVYIANSPSKRVEHPITVIREDAARVAMHDGHPSSKIREGAAERVAQAPSAPAEALVPSVPLALPSLDAVPAVDQTAGYTRAPERVVPNVPDIDFNAPAQHPGASSQNDSPFANTFEVPNVPAGQVMAPQPPAVAPTPPQAFPAAPAAVTPAIAPDAFRTRGTTPVPPVAPSVTQVPPASPPAPPVHVVAPPVHVAADPVPARLSAPWIAGNADQTTDELGRAWNGADPVSEPADSAFGLDETPVQFHNVWQHAEAPSAQPMTQPMTQPTTQPVNLPSKPVTAAATSQPSPLPPAMPSPPSPSPTSSVPTAPAVPAMSAVPPAPAPAPPAPAPATPTAPAVVESTKASDMPTTPMSKAKPQAAAPVTFNADDWSDA